LFEAFSQEETGYTRKFEGNGLGLALVKKYAAINNVKIDIKSQKGIGTKFTIYFKRSLTLSH
jgi:signal transduction histidine kinase